MHEVSSHEEVIAALTERDLNPQDDPSAIDVEIMIDLGHTRTYQIYLEKGLWHMGLSEVVFDQRGEDHEEQSTFGPYTSASDIADAIEQNESDSGSHTPPVWNPELDVL